MSDVLHFRRFLQIDEPPVHFIQYEIKTLKSLVIIPQNLNQNLGDLQQGTYKY